MVSYLCNAIFYICVDLHKIMWFNLCFQSHCIIIFINWNVHILLLKMHPCLLLKKYIQYSQHWFSHSATSTHKNTNQRWKGTKGSLHIRNIGYKSHQDSFSNWKILALCSFLSISYIVNIGQLLCWKQCKERKGKNEGKGSQLVEK